MKRSTDLLAQLNPPQQEAVRHTEGPVLVLAGAGSGKTRVITRRIAYLLGKGLAAPSQILALTFTNKAANEMRERVGELIGPAAATEVVLSTFHSFCLRVLRAEIEHLGYRRNFTISSESDVRTLMRRILGDIQGPNESFSPQTFQERIGILKNAEAKAAESEPAAPENGTADKYQTWLPEVYERYHSALRAANAVDFDDLLLLTLRLWREHPRILARHQDRFKYVLVDEFQDTNRVQYAILQTLVDKHRNLCVVGDDDQSIYGWRGADSRNILEFERDFPETKLVTLDQNYRSTETILRAANSVIVQNQVRRPKQLWSTIGAGRAIDLIVTGNQEHEAKTVVSWLRLIQDKTGAGCQDFAVLYRSNQQSRPIEIACRQTGIPYTVYGGQDFFERAEVRDIISYLKIISNPRDEAAFLRIINMPRRGIGDATLHQIHELCRQESLPLASGVAEAVKRGLASGEAQTGIQTFLALVHDFRQRFRDRQTPMHVLVRELTDRIQYRAELDRTSKNPELAHLRWTNVEAVVEAVKQYETDAQSPTLSSFLDDSSLNSDDQRFRTEQRRSGVSLMTIHSAKGLEFPFVFIVGVEEGLLPHEKSLRDGNIDEERRLFYVALTRGKRHVTLFESLSRELHGRERMTKTSRFLADIPPELIKKNVFAAADMVAEHVAPPKPKPVKRRRKTRI